MRRLAGLGAAALFLAAAASPAGAFVPSAEKIAAAVALANQKSGRSVPLLFDVTLRIGAGEPVATGVLATHPTGLARLELVSTGGFVERHLLQGNAYAASRDGQLLGQPRPFLPPIFLLQAGSAAALQAALSSFGVAPGTPVLGRVDDHDCYVFGGRARRGPDGREPMLPSLWVDVETYDVVRIDSPSGVRYRLGPTVSFGGVRAPEWIEIEVPGSSPARLDIQRAAPASAPAASFGIQWLNGAAAP